MWPDEALTNVTLVRLWFRPGAGCYLALVNRFLFLGFFFGVVALALSCAHSPPTGERSGPVGASEAFWKRARWRDWRGAAEVIVPERQKQFEKAREVQGDEKDLTLTDYELLEAKPAIEGKAVVVTKVSWIRLPSVTEKTDTVTTELVQLGSVWFVAQQDSGPFAPELKEAYRAPKAE